MLRLKEKQPLANCIWSLIRIIKLLFKLRAKLYEQRDFTSVSKEQEAFTSFTRIKERLFAPLGGSGTGLTGRV